MTEAVFFRTDEDGPCGFCLSGHADLADEGEDILCAAISAMTQLTVNTVRDFFKAPCTVQADENTASVSLRLQGQPERSAAALLAGFQRELSFWSQQYPSHLRVSEQTIHSSKLKERK